MPDPVVPANRPAPLMERPARTRRRARSQAWPALATCAALASPAIAQTVPRTANAPTREEVQRAAPTAAADPARRGARLTVESEVPRAPCALADPRFAATMMTFRGATFANLRGLAPAALAPAFQAMIGKTVPLAALCDVRDAASALLRRAGYVAAVQVPPQQVVDGIVRFDVVTARLVALHVSGSTGRSARLIAAYLDRLVGEPVFNEKAAERYLLLARDLPGTDVRLVLRPADTVPGDVVGEISVRRRPLDLSATLQNFGSATVGRWGLLVSAQAGDVIGGGDRVTLGLFNTLQPHEQTVVQAGYDIRLGGEGWTIGGRTTLAWTRPDLGAGQHPLTSRTFVGSLEAAYPFRRSQLLDLRGAAGIDLVDQDLRFYDATLTRDRLRIAYARLDLSAIDPAAIARLYAAPAAAPRWRVAASVELRHGLGLLGAGSSCRIDLAPVCRGTGAAASGAVDAATSLVRMSGAIDIAASSRLTVSFSPRVQYAFDPLASYEQYSGGSYTIGRGYDPGAAIGDSGAGTSLELRYGALAPQSRRAATVQPYVFADAAWLWTRNPGATDTGHDRLLSAGAGLRAAIGDRARADLLLAVPLRTPAGLTRRGGLRALLSVTTRLAPSSP